MATAQPERSRELERLTEGTNEEDGGEDVLKIRSHLIALFAVKAYLDSDVEDFKIWTLGKDEGESSPSMAVVCAYKTRDGTKEKGGWTYMIWPTVLQNFITEPEDTSQLMPLGKELFSNYFHIFERLKKALKLGRDFDNTRMAMEFFIPGERIIASCKFLQKKKERDFLFKRELWKFSDDIVNTKKIVENIAEGFSLLMNEKAEGGVRRKYSKDQLKIDVKEFISKVSFASNISLLQGGKDALETEIRQCMTPLDSETIQRTLMEMIKDLIEKHQEGCKVITDANVRVCFEGMRIGRDEGSKMKFNLSDPVSDFVGRGRELRQLLYFLGGTSSQWEVGPAKKVVVSGFGGVGKSELAREYCRRHSSLYDNIAWIHAENEERIAESFRALATEKLGIQTKTTDGSFRDPVGVTKECFDVLKTRNTLMVLDNAESLQHIKKYLPGDATKGRQHIILTSRYQEWNDLPLIPLESFHPKEAMDLVKGSLSQFSSWNEDDGLNLCKSLGYYPLALKQAVSYIREQHLSQGDGKIYSIHEYLKAMESQADALLDLPITDDINAEYGETTYKVMSTTLQHLKKTLSGQMAITILNILSYLSPGCIDVDRMCDANPRYSKGVILKCFSVLAKLSFVTFDLKSVRIHRMVQLLNRMKLANLEHEVSVLREAMLFANAIGVQHMVSVWEFAEKYETLVREYSTLPEEIINKLFNDSLYDLLLKFSLRAEETLKNALGPHHPDTLIVMRLSSNSYQFFGNIRKATEKMKKCIDAYRELPEGLRSPDYFRALCNYATLLHNSAKFEESIRVYKEIMSDGPSVLGENANLIHIVRSELNMLSRLRPDSNEIEDIIGSGNRSVRIGNYSSQSRGLPESLEEMGNNSQNLQNTNGIVVQSAIDRAHFCEILALNFNKALSLHRCGKLREALKEMKTIYEDSKKINGEDHVLSQRIKICLGTILFDVGKVVGAEKELDEVCSRMGASCRDHNLRVSTWSLRAKILCARDKTEEAIPHILACCRNESLDSIDVAGLIRAMSVLTYAEKGGKHKFVARVMKKVFRAINDCGGRNDIPKIFLVHSGKLGFKLSNHGLKKQALVIMKEVYLCFKAVNGEKHVETQEVKMAFANICCTIGDGDTLNKGLGYLSEIRATLSTMENVRDHRIKKLNEATKKLLKFWSNK